MKFLDFLKKENQNIQKVDRKLEKFHDIFNGILVISRAGRKNFEIVNSHLKNFTSQIATFEDDLILKQDDSVN